MLRRIKSLRNSLIDSALKVLYKAPWILTIFIFRLLYGFRTEGEENIPSEGPFILAICEPSLIGVLISGWFSTRVLIEALERNPGSAISYMQDQLFALPYFRKLQDMKAWGRYSALIPHSAGRMALTLVDGYRVLSDGGIVIMNPQGDGPWDGRPLPIGRSLAWLALHSATPIVPAVCSIGAYEIWPRWLTRPYLRGRVLLRVGQPIRVCDTPQQRVTDSDLAQATAQVQAVIEDLCYGPGGVKEWTGPRRRHGGPVEEAIHLRPGTEPVAVDRVAEKAQVPVLKRGLANLLWRCPLCRTNDALVHQRPWLRSERLCCQACDARWAVRPMIGKDFRLELVAGSSDLVGLDMALSDWYDKMKRDFRLAPVPADGVDLMPGEELYLEADDVPLLPYRPNPLFDGYAGREPPQTQPPGKPEFGDWASIGEGRLLLTSHRLQWQGPHGELDFNWSSVTAVYLWLVNTLGINYGTARYRLSLGQQVGLKWLAYAGTLAQAAAESNSHSVTVSTF